MPFHVKEVVGRAQGGTGPPDQAWAISVLQAHCPAELNSILNN